MSTATKERIVHMSDYMDYDFTVPKYQSYEEQRKRDIKRGKGVMRTYHNTGKIGIPSMSEAQQAREMNAVTSHISMREASDILKATNKIRSARKARKLAA
ncbi:hypothetical protein FWG76_01090 [Candidatus Saccharibacteria bacterium]|nr:hypothetical protein [Candidatus Saccharibacteria bacterium]